jgi:hypothetical protein
MITQKDRKHSGRKTICVKDNEYPYQQTYWDDWNDYRDGMRNKKKDKPKVKNRKWRIRN